MSSLVLFALMFSISTDAAPPALAEKPAQAAVTCERNVVVPADDWPSKLAGKFHDNPLAFRAIFLATNAKVATDSSYATITDPNLIEVGWKLCIPSREGAEAMLDGEMAGDQTTAATDDIPTTTMASASGETYTLSLKTLPNSRDFIYCKLVFDYGDAGQDIYSTSSLAPRDTDWWDNLDLDAAAAVLGANSITKNGPQWWSMDEVGVLASEPVTMAGVDMNFGAVLPAGITGEGGIQHYQVFNTAKNQYLLWEASQPTYQLVIIYRGPVRAGPDQPRPHIFV